MSGGKIRVAIAGVGNCASSLVQGVSWYSRNNTAAGLITPLVGAYAPADIEFVAAFDVDKRKVGKTLSEAIYAAPNNTMRIEQSIDGRGAARVQMGPIHDGVAPHMAEFDEASTIVPSDAKPVDVAAALREAKADILLCYLPVGSTKAVQYYADAALASGTAFVNCVPVFIANDPKYAERFRAAGIPIVGDDIRSQVGATIVHQRLMELLTERGYELENSYQLNFGGNTDFMNMLARDRLTQKKKSKTNAVRAKIGTPISDRVLHVGPSDYVPHLRDTKIAYIRGEAKGFGGAPLSFELRLQVEDSPNSAGVVMDALRYAAIARRMGKGGPVDPVCSYYMKSPPTRLSDEDARRQLANIAAGETKGAA